MMPGIPIGTPLRYGVSQEFYTIEGVQVKKGAREVSVRIIAEAPGTSGIVKAGEISALHTAMLGVEAVSNKVPTYLSAESSEREKRLLDLLTRYEAEDLSNRQKALLLWQETPAYQGKHVFLRGKYVQSIGAGVFIVNISIMSKLESPPTLVVQWDSSRNLAQENGWFKCIVKVLGATDPVIPGANGELFGRRNIPHVQEVECIEQ